MPKVSHNREPRNTAGTRFLEGRIDSIEVTQWHPLPDGRGKPTQVHLAFAVKGMEWPIVLRFKGHATLDKLIGALASHRFDVWPERKEELDG